jgi:small subunit ribosomal protein S21
LDRKGRALASGGPLAHPDELCHVPPPRRGAGAFVEDFLLMSNESNASPDSTPPQVTEAIQCKPLEVVVGDRGIERAIKHLKRKMASEGILRELKRRRHYMKPSIKRRKKQSEAARRRRKRQRTDIA